MLKEWKYAVLMCDLIPALCSVLRGTDISVLGFVSYLPVGSPTSQQLQNLRAELNSINSLL